MSKSKLFGNAALRPAAGAITIGLCVALLCSIAATQDAFADEGPSAANGIEATASAEPNSDEEAVTDEYDPAWDGEDDADLDWDGEDEGEGLDWDDEDDWGYDDEDLDWDDEGDADSDWDYEDADLDWDDEDDADSDWDYDDEGLDWDDEDDWGYDDEDLDWDDEGEDDSDWDYEDADLDWDDEDDADSDWDYDDESLDWDDEGEDDSDWDYEDPDFDWVDGCWALGSDETGATWVRGSDGLVKIADGWVKNVDDELSDDACVSFLEGKVYSHDAPSPVAAPTCIVGQEVSQPELAALPNNEAAPSRQPMTSNLKDLVSETAMTSDIVADDPIHAPAAIEAASIEESIAPAAADAAYAEALGSSSADESADQDDGQMGSAASFASIAALMPLAALSLRRRQTEKQ